MVFSVFGAALRDDGFDFASFGSNFLRPSSLALAFEAVTSIVPMSAYWLEHPTTAVATTRREPAASARVLLVPDVEFIAWTFLVPKSEFKLRGPPNDPGWARHHRPDQSPTVAIVVFLAV
jgi:hypothetical protein